MTRNRSIAVAIAVVLIAGLALAGKSSLEPGDHAFSIDYGGISRKYLVHVPPQATSGQPLPIVLNFHGGGGNAAGAEKYSMMDPVADRGGFIAVYPDGTGGILGRLHTWNAGRCCGHAMQHNIDDAGFVIALLDDLRSKTPVDQRRVYATGLSNGAMMSYRLAAERQDRIAAIAPIAGAGYIDPRPSSRAMPVMHIHSLDDPRALYHGGIGPAFPLTSVRTAHVDVEQMLGKWIAHDKCSGEPKILPAIKGEPGSPEDGVTATKYVWASCADGSEVVLWKLTGSGHVWPGGVRDFYPGLLGRGTAIIDANQEMWEFFKRFSLPAEAAKSGANDMPGEAAPSTGSAER